MTPSAELGILAEERDRLLRALRDLEAERRSGEVNDDDYRTLKADYTARAAEVLRRLDGLEPPPPAHPSGLPSDPAGTAAPGPPPSGGSSESPARGAGPTRRAERRRWKRAVVAGVGLVLVAGGLALVASGASGSRSGGQALSGQVPQPSPAQELDAARRAMATGDQVRALKLFQAVLAVEPDQPQALAYSGWLLRLAGDAQGSTKLIDQGLVAEEAAVKADPAYPDAHYFLGVMLLDEAHDPGPAVTQLQDYLASHPPAVAARAARAVLARAQAEAAGSAGSGPGGPAASGGAQAP